MICLFIVLNVYFSIEHAVELLFFMWLSFSQLYRPNIYPMDPGRTGIHLGVYMAPFFFLSTQTYHIHPLCCIREIFKRTHHCSQATVCVVMDTTFCQVPLLWCQNHMNCYCFPKWARVWQEHLATPSNTNAHRSMDRSIMFVISVRFAAYQVKNLYS